MSRCWAMAWSMLALACSMAPRATAAEPKVRGGKGVLKMANENVRYHLVQPGAAISFNVVGPGQLQLRARAVQNGNGDGPIGILHVAIDGNEAASVGVVPGLSHFAARRDFTTGPSTDRNVKVGDGPRAIVIFAEGGPVAVSVEFGLEAVNLLTATPLVAEKPAPPSNGQGEARDSSLHASLPESEQPVPMVIESASSRPTWPLFFAGGALATGIAGGVVWGIAASTDASYNSSTEGPGRDGKLSAANNELHAAMVLGAVAIALGATATVGLILQ